MYFLDTNALLNIDLGNLSDTFLLSSVTLSELDNIKESRGKTEEVRHQARNAVRWLTNNTAKYHVIVAGARHFELLDSYNLSHTPDNIIMACAALEDYVYSGGLQFVTFDLLCKIIAHDVFKLHVADGDELMSDSIYSGYIKYTGTSEQINDWIANMDYSKMFVNQYVIFENIDTTKTLEMRCDGSELVNLRLPPSKTVKGKNPLQRCALDLMMQKEITTVAILGGYGTGKTFLAMNMALHHLNESSQFNKILGVREAMGEGKQIGYLKGTFEDKTEKFFLPLAQQMDNQDYIYNLMDRGALETTIPFYMKGCTYNNTVLVVDEAEDLTEAQIKLIGTRLGTDSKIYFSGDYKQSLINKSHNNALIKMCRALRGNPMFGCIILDDDVRSSTSKMFADLFTGS